MRPTARALAALLTITLLAAANAQDPAIDWYGRVLAWERDYRAAYQQLFLQYGMQGRAPGLAGVDTPVKDELMRVSRAASDLWNEGLQILDNPPDQPAGSRAYIARQRMVQAGTDGLFSMTHLAIRLQLENMPKSELILLNTSLVQAFEIRDLWGQLYRLAME